MIDAKNTIPEGNVTKFRPYWNKNLENAVLERRKARKIAEKKPTPASRNNFNRLTARVRDLTRTGKRAK